MKLTILKYAESVIGENFVFLGGKKGRIWPISFFLFLFEEENRKILVDTGCNVLPGFPLSRFIKPLDLLLKYGVKAEEITDLIITHSHSDHAELASEFKNATVYVQQDEYNGRKSYFLDNRKIITFENEIQVADSIKVIKIGGHSIGSCVVEFTKNDKNYVIAGDEAYSRECIKRKIPTGASVNAIQSREFIEKYSDENYTVLYSHDMDILEGKNGFVTIEK
jgi:glyoxylase-like metal-dependent hydrolase (beta-lactamase superfamily II)